MDREESPYRRGNRFDVLPIPMVPEHCHTVDAGPVQLVVESRALTNAILDETYADALPVTDLAFDDHGASLHVCGTADGLEHVRFDCFEHEPHYHYIEHGPGSNVIVRIDEVAVGDPVEFTLRCVRERLPEMLENAGQAELGAATRAEIDKVHVALERVAELMARIG